MNDLSKKSIPVVYIAGTSYCGSTLMSFILNSHPEICSTGEMGTTARYGSPNYPCSCGEVIVDCPFYEKIKIFMESFGESFDRTNMKLRFVYPEKTWLRTLFFGRLGSFKISKIRNLFRPLYPGYLEQMKNAEKRNQLFISKALDMTEKRVFLDATKHWFRIPFLNKMEGTYLKVIHLVRDPRGFSNSARKRKMGNLSQIARILVRENEACEYMMESLPEENTFFLNYDAFCLEPEKEFIKIQEFIGVNPVPLPENFRDYPHHILGNSMRKFSDKRSRIIHDTKWENDLSKSEQQLILNICWDTMERMGFKAVN